MDISVTQPVTTPVYLKPGRKAGHCKICGRPTHGKGLCLMHYMRDYRKKIKAKKAEWDY